MRACERSRIQRKYKRVRPFCTTLELLAIRNVSTCTTFHNAFDTVPAAHGADVLRLLGHLVKFVNHFVTDAVVGFIRA